jgi:hypothetical protein
MPFSCSLLLRLLAGRWEAQTSLDLLYESHSEKSGH